MIPQVNQPEKQAGISILISNSVDMKSKFSQRDVERNPPKLSKRNMEEKYTKVTF